MRSLVAVVVALCLVACGAPPVSAPPPDVAAPPPAPRCAENSGLADAAATHTMKDLGAPVRRCLITGAHNDAPALSVEVIVEESGKVKTAKVSGASDNAVRACAENALRAANFPTFCGDEVVVAWRYAMQ